MKTIKILLDFIRFKQVTADQYHIQRFVSVRHQNSLFEWGCGSRTLTQNYMKYFLLFLLLSFRFVYSQHSFEIVLGDKDGHEYVLHTIEHQDNYYAVGHKAIPENVLSNINRISLEGKLIQSEWYSKTDTASFLSFILPKENGNLLCIGKIAPATSYRYSNTLYFREIAPDLSLVGEKYDSLPVTNTNTNFVINNYLISPMNEIIVQGIIDTALEGHTEQLFFAKYDFSGNRLQHKLYYQYKDYSQGSTLFFNEDSTAFYLCGSLTIQNWYEWAKFDLDFNFLASGYFPTNETSLTMTPVTVEWLRNGNFIMANKLRKVGDEFVRGLEMRIYTPDFELLENVYIYDDRKVDIPFFRGMGFIDEDLIWVATHQPEYEYQPTDIKFYLFDSNLNLKGSKVYHMDVGHRLIDLLATSDSGCLVSGARDQKPLDPYRDAYILKVSLSDVITGSSEQMAIGNEVRLGPVPATDRLAVQTRNTDCTLLLRDMKGQIILQRRLHDGVNQIDIRHLPSGMYIATVSNNESKHIENFKIIKQ
jgi:hypothetical protein